MRIRPVPEHVRQFDEEFSRVPDYPPEDCPVRSALLAVSNDKWKIPIVMKLGRYGKLRFRELLRALPHVRPKALTKALRSLEEEGFVTREVFGEVPMRVEYALSESANAFIPVLFQVQEWAVNIRSVPDAMRSSLRVVSSQQPAFRSEASSQQ